MKFAAEKEILPAFPKTPHLPHLPNTEMVDKVATDDEAAVIFQMPISVEEKIDGSSCGMTMLNGEPLIRNRDHILRKGYHKKDSAAKMQFASVWNWWYENKARFEHILSQGPYSIYGEWCVARHGIAYTKLPDWFIAYDLFHQENKAWVDPPLARCILMDAGFPVPRCFHEGMFHGDYNLLAAWANEVSPWTNGEKGEGVYIKVCSDKSLCIEHRFKMVRPDFVRGEYWNPKALTKNGRA